ncbi:MAG: hypothetical protein BAJATHORv1_10100 [Candidatus Thorarchaeota archaeon]|nr:MAG: hypothetical protein BAJATHORv1_10100 [Candidatus Thorarchaeota archaeon]
MISSEKPQNAIVIAVLVVALISGASIYSTANYYSGTYILVRYLDVEMVGLEITNMNTTDLDVNPIISLSFRFEAPSVAAGEARLSSFRCTVLLNGDELSYISLKKTIPQDRRTLTSTYNETFTVSEVIDTNIDKWTIYNASQSGEWFFLIEMMYFYYVFESRAVSFRPMTYDSVGFIT